MSGDEPVRWSDRTITVTYGEIRTFLITYMVIASLWDIAKRVFA